MSAYVMQDDLLHAELTVGETIWYAAQLRIPVGLSKEERIKRGDEVLQLMGISHCRNTKVGNTQIKGISGGERKRLCVAIELLNHPQLLFLDEPTSGLDSSTAFSVCKALKNLSVIGECTVVCTIHQPAPNTFNLFDNLILMKKGAIVYQGSSSKSTIFLDRLGMPCPGDANLADHLLEVVTPGIAEGDKMDEHMARIVPVDLSLGIEKMNFTDLESTKSFLNQFATLCRRNLHQYIRRKDIIAMSFAVNFIIAFFIGGGGWHNIGTGQASVATRVPALFFCCVNQGIVASFMVINSFPGERAIMLRERQAGAYSTSSYFLAKTAVDMLTQILPPVVFTVIVYYMIGFQHDASKFFLFLMFMSLDAMAATSLATAGNHLMYNI